MREISGEIEVRGGPHGVFRPREGGLTRIRYFSVVVDCCVVVVVVIVVVVMSCRAVIPQKEYLMIITKNTDTCEWTPNIVFRQV